MNTKTQHPFSIDFITGEAMRSENDDLGLNMYNPDQLADNMEKAPINNCRQTPSPTDSGLESDHSPSRLETHNASKDNSIAELQVLLSLEKNASGSKAKVTDSNADDKPTQSYIALISMAILSTPGRRMLLSDIYQYVMDNFDYYNNNEKAWRNSIRHNLSLNECFVKAGRADNGKGNYWSIHPACIEDFANGDFRRRQARRRARKSLKDTNQQHAPSSVYRYNIGYVPMTASHIAYHPYNNATAASSMYYPQSRVFPPMAHAHPQTTSSSAFLHTNQSQAQSSYLSGCAFSGPQGKSSQGFSASAQKLLADQTNSAALSMQAFAQQQLASSLQFQNW
ncbi:forkhead box protein fkh-2-like [Mercenaria mercenaria]|uniref:forkhead box protein fkh-2-like n=1 Tax=Mercenaria mercenaria TaxID=6596 RepID=UPI00234EDC5D|nr:forkhead box protein fkh-2-like [Mercenaria mercenaria]